MVSNSTNKKYFLLKRLYLADNIKQKIYMQ